jgi:hypothetical protein
MQEDPNTAPLNITVTDYIDPEDWQIAFEPYEGESPAALTLGFRLMELKRLIRDLDMHEALREIDTAIDCLYEHSDFRSISRELFETAIAGKLTTDREAVLRHLGMRI